jgi:hypothetical protein
MGVAAIHLFNEGGCPIPVDAAKTSEISNYLTPSGRFLLDNGTP